MPINNWAKWKRERFAIVKHFREVRNKLEDEAVFEDDFKELKVLNNNVYGVSNDTVYIYNNKIGLKKAIVNRELIYNYKNIYDVYES